MTFISYGCDPRIDPDTGRTSASLIRTSVSSYTPEYDVVTIYWNPVNFTLPNGGYYTLYGGLNQNITSNFINKNTYAQALDIDFTNAKKQYNGRLILHYWIRAYNEKGEEIARTSADRDDGVTIRAW